MVKISCNNVSIDPTTKISDSAIIKAQNIIIGPNCIIGDGVDIHVAGTLKIGFATVIKETNILCQNIIIGNNNYIIGVWIEGSMNSVNADVEIGNENLILQNTRINCNDNVFIGNDVGIGQYVEIWTHGTYLDILKGYPYNIGKVKIGDHVWLTAHSTVMPGVTIGNNIIIGNNSIVNKDVPSGCFFAGQPGRILKENCYPPKITECEKEGILDNIINDYLFLMKKKGLKGGIKRNGMIIIFTNSEGIDTTFEVNTRKVEGDINIFSEDFRDYLRFRGVKFFTDRPFLSIVPPYYNKIPLE